MKLDGNTKIIQAILSDDPKRRSKSLKEIYRTSFPKIETFILRNSGMSADAKDIFQEAMLIFYENISHGTFRGQSKVETYLFSICKNLWLQQLRKSKKSDDFLEEMTLNKEMEELEEVNTSLLADVFSLLKEDCQRILAAFYYHKKSIRELQLLFGMNSEQVVKNKKSRCLRYLMEIVREKNLNQQSFLGE